MKLEELLIWCLDNDIRIALQKTFCKVQQRKNYQFKFTNLPKSYPLKVMYVEYDNLDWAINVAYDNLSAIVDPSNFLFVRNRKNKK